ncbi:hypothetical protein OIO90_005155 [Microbotryomycetes sp. JL221]|nr:hypothetical protein OIO90_005155 [Microbotryomycetes sp. JL221]
MRARRISLVVGALCLSFVPATRAAWGRKDSVAKPGTPVDAAAPPIPAADPIDGNGFIEASILTGDHINAATTTTTASLPYDGTEYKWRMLTFRPNEFKVEAVLTLLVLTYLGFSLIGARYNKQRATKWFKQNLVALEQEFAGIGFGDTNKQVESDGHDEFLTFATGRRGVEHAWIKVQTQPNHDVLTTLYHLVRGIMDYNYDSGADRITIDFKLAQPEGTPGANFCFAVCDRRKLRSLRERWDMSTFTNTTETSNVDESVILCTENGEITKTMMNSEMGLSNAIKPGSELLKWFECLIVSDMGSQRLDEEKPKLPENEFHLILTLRLPNQSKMNETKQWLSIICNIADVIHKKENLLPNMQVVKLKKRRQETLQTALFNIQKSIEEEQNEKKEDVLALRRKQEKQREEEKLSNMSKSERIKYQEKKRADEQRALQRKMMKTQIKRS